MQENQNSKPLNMEDFALLESSKLISRKIWVIEKFCKFHTVFCAFFQKLLSSFQCRKKVKVGNTDIDRKLNSSLPISAIILPIAHSFEGNAHFAIASTIKFSLGIATYLRISWKYSKKGVLEVFSAECI